MLVIFLTIKLVGLGTDYTVQMVVGELSLQADVGNVCKVNLTDENLVQTFVLCTMYNGKSAQVLNENGTSYVYMNNQYPFFQNQP